MKQVFLLPLLLLAAPASAAQADEAGATAYVLGRFAFADARLDEAARRFEVALRTDANDPSLLRRTFDLSLAAGDQKQTYRLAERLAATGEKAPPVALTRAIAAMQARDWKKFDAALVGYEDGSAALVKPIIQAWSLAARGDVAGALARVDTPSARGITRSYFSEHRAYLLALAGRWQEAADAFTGIVASEGANVPRLRIAAAHCLARAGKRDAAITMLGGGGDQPQLAAARQRLLAGRDIGGLIDKPTQGVATLLLRVATDLSRDRAADMGVLFARLGSFAAPEMPEAWLVTADLLGRSDQPQAALDALTRVRDPLFERAAAGQRAGILADQKRWTEARATLAAYTQRPDVQAEDWLRLADLERRAENWRESAAAISRAIALLPANPMPENAVYWFLRGSALERAGDWRQGEADLRKAIQLQPGNPTFLNYLGYTLLDHNEKLDEAEQLIGRALGADPDNGSIIDSAGWMAFTRGRYDEAVDLLTKAFAAEPTDPAIADHLGDALWKAGRRIEARSAWTQAQALNPDAKLAPRLAMKLDYGLEVAARVAQQQASIGK